MRRHSRVAVTSCARPVSRRNPPHVSAHLPPFAILRNSNEERALYNSINFASSARVGRFSRCLAGGCGPRPRRGLPKIVVGSVTLHVLNMTAVQASSILPKLPTSKHATGSVCKLRSAGFLLLLFPESRGRFAGCWRRTWYVVPGPSAVIDAGASFPTSLMSSAENRVRDPREFVARSCFRRDFIAVFAATCRTVIFEGVRATAPPRRKHGLLPDFDRRFPRPPSRRSGSPLGGPL